MHFLQNQIFTNLKISELQREIAKKVLKKSVLTFRAYLIYSFIEGRSLWEPYELQIHNEYTNETDSLKFFFIRMVNYQMEL